MGERKDDGGPAFASDTCNGMSLRDWFAGQALAGISAYQGQMPSPEAVATEAYAYADAMLKARDQ